MKKYIALRARNIRDAKAAFRAQGAIVVNSSMDTRDPALKNLIEGLSIRGLTQDIDGCRLNLFLVEDDRSVDHYLQFNEVEVAFTEEWFEQQKASVRYLTGIKYCDATCGWAELFELKNQQRSLDYQVPAELVA